VYANNPLFDIIHIKIIKNTYRFTYQSYVKKNKNKKTTKKTTTKKNTKKKNNTHILGNNQMIYPLMLHITKNSKRNIEI
jgi:hypothetical protein